MKAFEPYVRFLESLALQVGSLTSPNAEHEDLVAAALDGQPSERLRKLVTLPARRSAGAFFTGQVMADRALGPYMPTLSNRSIVHDPACGVADLLMACARRLPLQHDLATTIASWGEQLRGLDIYPEFIRAAKARLVLLAIMRGVPTVGRPLPPLAQTFPYLRVANALEERAVASASHIVLNPPYCKVPAPADCAWGSGKVSQAALFVDRCLTDATAGTRIVAILPDVLRTGSLFSRWRTAVEARARIESVEVVGAFDAWADVDVFILRMIVGAPGRTGSSVWWKPAVRIPTERVGDRFDVHVGAVIPHRHKHLGAWYPYVYARLLPQWGTFDVNVGKRRRFGGRTFLPPFVAVRRTSAPRDRARALATLVVGQRPVAVENHLLVLVPRDPSLESCRQLLAVLQDDRTNRWLDERIRCRHLTVGVLHDLPWWNPDS
ncbi:MAG: hypothetical protein QOF89_1236 [Acidobacteriota bacterium]|nr:hypothetical protein [Acidobacteriota bacterium]